MMSSHTAPGAPGSAAAGSPSVVVAGVLPPPRNGMAIVTGHVIGVLERSGMLLECRDLTAGRELGGARRHLEKVRKVFAIAPMLLRHRGTPGRSFYTHCDANSGKLYTLFLCALARLLGYRILLHHHSYFYINQYSPLIAAIAKVMGRDGRHLLLCDCMEADFAVRYGAGVSTAIVHNRLWYPRRKPDRLPAGPAVTIGHLGNLTWTKGSGAFLDLFEDLVARGVDARAIMLGDTPDAELNAKIAGVAGRHRDRFEHIETGAPSAEVKDGFFDAIDFFVMPTQYRVEAQPLVLIEARAMGVPVIATDRGCIKGDHEGAPNLIVPSDVDFVAAAGAWLAERRFEHLPAGAARAHEPDIRSDLEHFRNLFLETASAPADRAMATGAAA